MAPFFPPFFLVEPDTANQATLEKRSATFGQAQEICLPKKEAAVFLCWPDIGAGHRGDSIL